MVLPIHVSREFTNYTVAEKIAFGKAASSLLLTNVAAFATPDVPLTALNLLNTNLDNANKAYITNPNTRGALLDAEKAWNIGFRKEAKYVDRIADGDGAIIDLSGFKQTKSVASAGQPSVTPIVEDAHPVAKGAAHASTNHQPGSNFLFILSNPGDSVNAHENQIDIVAGGVTISIIMDTHPSADFIGVPSGDKKLTVLAGNRNGNSALTSPVDLPIP